MNFDVRKITTFKIINIFYRLPFMEVKAIQGVNKVN